MYFHLVCCISSSCTWYSESLYVPGYIFSQDILVYIHTTVARSWYLLGTARYSFYTVLYHSAEN